MHDEKNTSFKLPLLGPRRSEPSYISFFHLLLPLFHSLRQRFLSNPTSSDIFLFSSSSSSFSSSYPSILLIRHLPCRGKIVEKRGDAPFNFADGRTISTEIIKSRWYGREIACVSNITLKNEGNFGDNLKILRHEEPKISHRSTTISDR